MPPQAKKPNLDVFSSPNRRSSCSLEPLSEILPKFLNEPLYEFNSVRFKVNKQGVSIKPNKYLEGGESGSS